MLKLFNQLTTLITLSILISSCGSLNYASYQEALIHQQATYKNAVANNRATARNLYTTKIESTAELNQEKQTVTKEQDKQQQELLKQKIDEGEAEIPIELAQKLLIGTFRGTTCNGETNVEVNINELQKKGFWLNVKGSLRAFTTQSGQADIDTPIAGSFDLLGGFLSLGSSPKLPPKEEIIRESKQRKEQLNSDIKAIEREASKDIQKAFSNLGPFASQEQRAQANKNAHVIGAKAQSRILQIQEQDKQYRTTWKNSLDAIQPVIKISIDVARDKEGKGWEGLILSEGFKNCDRIIFSNDSGITTNELPPITGKLATQRARPRFYSAPSLAFQLYWLNIAANQGYGDALFYLGQIYDRQGEKSPTDYQHALQYYRSSADAGDQRAQRALAKMYANGNGTAINLVEAKKWRNKADSVLSKAAKICSSPKTLTAFEDINRQERERTQFAAIVGMMATGMTLNPGDIRVTEIVVDDVASIDSSFTCTVYGERVGANIDASSVPDIQYYAVDGNNNYISLGNNSGDKVAANTIANIAKSFAERSFKRTIEIQPLGNTSYKLKSGSSTATFDLN